MTVEGPSSSKERLAAKPTTASGEAEGANGSRSTVRSSTKKPSPEEIEAKRKQRAEKKQRDAEEKKRDAQMGIVGVTKDGKVPFKVRQWETVRDRPEETMGRHRVRLLSWNILAQGLVRRKLFPGSDCLKWKEREDGLMSEMVSHNWDVGAFQEVDRIEAHGPNLIKSGRRYVYAKGYNAKQHGLMVAWRTEPGATGAQATLFEEQPAASKVIFFDRENADAHPGKAGSRSALSRVTRNIALFVALPFKKQDGDAQHHAKGPAGIIVATTHLFWHPMHAYERVRQTGILKRRLLSWREEHSEWADWPLFLAGDFNDQPHSAAYKLVTGEPLTQHCLDEIRQSAVVHISVDELGNKAADDEAAKTEEEAIIANLDAAQQLASGQDNVAEAPDEEDGDGEGEEGEDDQVLKNCRLPTPADGLLSIQELVQLHDLSRPPPASHSSTESSDSLLGQRVALGLTSLYGTHFNRLDQDQKGNYFGSPDRQRERHDDPDWTPDMPNPHLGPCFEPMYTLYSTLFCLTLDYIFLFPANPFSQSATLPTVSALLPTHTTDVLKPGVPRRGVCASDHIAIGAEIVV